MNPTATVVRIAGMARLRSRAGVALRLDSSIGWICCVAVAASALGSSWSGAPAQETVAASSDSVLVEFVTTPDSAEVEIQRTRGGLLLETTPMRRLFPRREMLTWSVRKPGFNRERGRTDLRSGPDTVLVYVTLTSSREVVLRVRTDPPAESLRVETPAGRILHSGAPALEFSLERQPIVILSAWKDGSRRRVEEDLARISMPEFDLILEPLYETLVLVLRSYPAATLTVRLIEGSRVHRGHGTLGIELAKEPVALIAVWPDGSQQKSTINLRAIKGNRLELDLWNRSGRAPVEVRAIPANGNLEIRSADGLETFSAPGRFRGWLRPQPYVASATWPVSPGSLGNPGHGARTIWFQPTLADTSRALPVLLCQRETSSPGGGR